MGRVVIIAYKPKIGKEEALKKLVKTHWPRLRQQGLVTEKEAYSLETQDGTLVEVFEWLSDYAIKTAHKNPTVQQIWREYAEVCTYTPLNNVAEAGHLFAEFTPLN